MLKLYDFALAQLGYLKAAMDELPSFRPDGRSPADVQALIDSAGPVRTDFLTAMTALEGARARRRTSIKTLHEACVDFGQQAPNAYRKEATVTECLESLPRNDRSIQETLARAEAILAQWAQLPPIGVPAADFTVAQVDEPLTRAGLEALRVVDQHAQLQRALLKGKQREVKDVVTAALTLGRSQFPKGSAQREIISAIPKGKSAEKTEP